MAISEIPSLHLKPVAYKTNRLYLKLPEGSIGNMTFARTSVARRTNKEGLNEEVATGIPRLDHALVNGVVQSCPDLLLEPTRTNICLRSEEFEHALWIDNAQMTVTANVTVSPDGTQNADKIVYVDNGSNGIITQNITVVDASDYELSIFMKGQKGGEKVKIDFRNSVTDGVSGTEVTLTKDWVRYTENLTSTAIDRGFSIVCLTGNGDSIFYVWGAQMELAVYGTSYIKTPASSSVTRATETLNNVGDSSTFNSEEGVLYVEMAALFNVSFFRMISISDGTASNGVQIRYTTTSQRIQAIYVLGGVEQANLIYVVSDVTDVHKVAIKWKINDFALWIDGVERAVDNSGNVLAVDTLTKLNFAQGGGTFDFYGRIRDLRVYKTALTDSELEELTT